MSNFTNIIQMDPLYIILLIGMWVYQGFHLKFLDQVIDEARPLKKPVLYAIMLFSAGSSGFFMAADVFTGGAVLALIVGLITAKKIDHKYWFYQAIMVILSYITFMGLFDEIFITYDIDWVGTGVVFVLVMIFSALDEVVHDYFSRERNKRLHEFLEHRWIMKIVAVLMPFFLPYVFWYHSVCFILLDVMYEIVAKSWHNELLEDDDGRKGKMTNQEAPGQAVGQAAGQA